MHKNADQGRRSINIRNTNQAGEGAMLSIRTRKAEMDENMQRKGTCQNTDGTGEMECVKILTVRKRRMCKIAGDEKSAVCCAGEKMQSALSEPGEIIKTVQTGLEITA